MKTRFDIYGKWITACGEVRSVSDMETDHIMNTMRMLIQKPSRTISMLIHDIESCNFMDMSIAWIPTNMDYVIKESIYNVTTMGLDDLKAYVKQTPLFKSMCDVLEKRGVNVTNILSILETCDSF